MDFSTSRLPKFVVYSLFVHLSVVAVLWKMDYQHVDHLPVEISFSMGATGDGRTKGVKVVSEKKVTPQVRPNIKSEVISDAVKPETTKAVAEGPVGEGGTGTNIGTGKEGEGYGSVPGLETARNKYSSLLAQTINKNKRYPRQAYSLNQEGTVVIRLKLDKQGKVLDLTVLEKAPFKSLTNATVEAIESIKIFPPIPDELGVDEVTYRIPIEYKIQMH